VILGLLALYLVALPPHLVHHIGNPESEAMPCTLFVQGKAVDQGTADPLLFAEFPASIGEVPTLPTPAILPAANLPLSGRSPPDPSV
jgi:hypothetical protein